MSPIHLYRIPQVVELTSGTGALMNFPVNRTDFSIPRYVDTEVDFWIKDHDRRAVDLTNATAVLHLMELNTGKLFLSRDLEVLDPVKGLARFFISAEESAALPLMGLRYSVVMTRQDGVQAMLYTDRDRKGLGVVDVINGPFPPPIEPYEIVPDSFVSTAGKLVSGSYPGAATVLNMGGQHSVVIDAVNFIGSFTVQGSLEAAPSSSPTDWFTIRVETFTGSETKVHVPFEGNLLWVRFIIDEDVNSTGEITAVTYRN